MDEKSSILLNSFFEDKKLVEHNINSFNNFVKYSIQKIISETPVISLDIKPEGYETYEIQFGEAWVEKPLIKESDGSTRAVLPHEIRTRDLVYEAPIFVKMKVVADGVSDDEITVNIGNIPIMMKSDLCYLNGLNRKQLIDSGEDATDPGGYFIINGTERSIVTIEDLAPNKFFVSKNKTGKFTHTGKVFSEKGGYSIPHSVDLNKQSMIFVSFTRLKDVPFVVIMKALGVTNDSEITKMITDREDLFTDIYLNLYEAQEIKTQKDAVDYIAKKARITYIEEEKRFERIMNLLDKYFLPHVGSTKSERDLKARYLASSVRKMLLIANKELDEDDKDNYSNKRLRLAGDMMEQLFRKSFRMMISDIKYNYERLIKRGRVPSLQGVTRSKILTSRVRSSLATGSWGGNRDGVSRRLERLNYYSTVSALRAVVSLLSSSRENFQARDLHPTHWGKLCTSETPEGQQVGLSKHLAMTAEISATTSVEKDDIFKELKELGMRFY